jgi:hypothetical protein
MNLLWVDANGVVLGTVVTPDYVAPPGLGLPRSAGLLLDGNGFIWIVDWISATVSVPMNSLVRYYTSLDCTGPAYVAEAFGSSPLLLLDRPRWVVSIRDVTGFFATGDQQRREDVLSRSYFETRCMGPTQPDHIAGMRFDQMRSVSPLTLNPVGPAHVEQR